MINLHNVTSITAGNVSEISPGRYARIICIKDEAHGTINLDLFSSDYTALNTNPMEADYWRTQAAEESARADAAESELARLRQAIDRIAQGVDACWH